MPSDMLAQMVSQSSVPAKRPAATAATETGSSIYESSAMSLYNAINMDADGALRSLLAPASLAPSQRHRMLEELTAGRGGVIRGILNSATNPLVLIGAALAMRWPVLAPEGVAALGSKLVEYGKWIPAPLRGLLGLNETFYGTKIPRLMNKIAGEANAFIEDHFMNMNKALEEWRGVAGRVETVKDQVRWAMQADPWWATKDGLKVLNAKVTELNTTRAGMSLAPLAKLRPEHFASAVIPEAGDGIVLGALENSSVAVKNTLAADLTRLEKMTGILSKQGVQVDEAVKWAKGGYFPRIGAMDREAVNRMKQDFVDRVLADHTAMQQTPKQLLGRMAVNRVGSISSESLATRTGILPPDARDLRVLGGVDESALRTLEQLSAERAAAHQVPAYTLKFSEAVRTYANRMGRGYAWSYVREAPESALSLGEALGRETKLVQAAEVAAGGSRAKTELMRSTYLPMAMGQSTFEQQMKALEWSGVRQAGWKIIESEKFGQLAGPEIQQKFRDMMASGNWTARTAGSRLAKYFYTTTLGMNFTSATQNLLQPILTTAPIIGMEATMRGIVSVVKKIPEFVSLRAAGVGESEAIAKLWPSFSKRAMESVGLFSDEALAESAKLAELNVMRPGSQFLMDKAQRVLMAPFRSSELFNRLTTYEGARIRGMMAGLSDVTAVDDFAQEVTNVSQLWSGKQAAPSMMINWNPALSQFMSFPAKLAGLMAGSALNIGGPFNPGTLGRAMVYSTVAYEMTKAVTGADISRGLLWGALPVPEANNDPFAPLPAVPPTLGIAAGVAMDVVGGKGDWSHTRKNIPTMLPAGAQLVRLSQMFTPDIARALGRSYVDRNQRLPNGNVPEFNADGQMIGARSEWSLAYDSLGIPGKMLEGGIKTNEQNMMQIVLANRDRIRQMRSSFIEAVLDADEAKADSLNRENLKLYGFPVQVRAEDFNAAKQRRLMPRLDRVMNTMPKEYRPLFSIAAGAALNSEPEAPDPELSRYFDNYRQNQQRESIRKTYGNRSFNPTPKSATIAF